MKYLRTLLVYACVITMVMSCFAVESLAADASGYSRDNAVDFARSHVNTKLQREITLGHEDCTVFARECAEAGGIPKDASRTTYGYTPEQYVSYLVDRKMATKEALIPEQIDMDDETTSVTTRMRYTIEENPNVELGDIISYECVKAKTDTHKKVFHLSVVTGFTDEGEILITQHNVSEGTAKLDANLATLGHSCGTAKEQNKIYLIHINPQKSDWILPFNGTVTGVKAAYNKNKNGITLSWNKKDRATKYFIYRATSATGTYLNIAETTGTTYTYIPVGDKSGKKLYFRIMPVRVSTIAGNTVTERGSQSLYVYASNLAKCGTVTVKKKTSKTVRVSWTTTSFGCAGYQISKSTSSLQSKCKVVKTVAGSNVKSAVVSAKKGKKYYYRVRSYRVVNGQRVYSAWSNKATYTLK